MATCALVYDMERRVILAGSHVEQNPESLGFSPFVEVASRRTESAGGESKLFYYVKPKEVTSLTKEGMCL